MEVLVVGLDGASWNIINPLIKKGLLPNLRKLKREGVRGSLISTVPSQTGPAWTSMFSGVNPGRHGVFDLTKVDFDEGIKPISSVDVKSKRIWDYTTDQGLDSLIINAPITYPPNSIKGKMISGFPSPLQGKEITKPPRLWNQITSRMSEEVRFQPKESLSATKTFYRNLVKITNHTYNATKLLLRKEPWNLAITVFMATDLVSHAFLDTHPSRGVPTAVKNIYRLVDKKIGELLKEVDDDTTIFIASDHGSIPSKRMYMINSLLLNLGYIKLNNSLGNKLRRGMYELTSLMPYFLFRKLSGMGDTHNKNEGNGGNEAIDREASMDLISLLQRVSLDISNIDLSKSKAICTGMGGIYTKNDKVKKRLIKELRSLKKEGFGSIFNVYPSELLYYGPFLGEGPDLVVKPRKKEEMISSRSGGGPWVNKLSMPSYPWKGTHKRRGIFLAYGEGLEEVGDINDVPIQDVAPTVLDSLNLNTPSKMDGDVLL